MRVIWCLSIYIYLKTLVILKSGGAGGLKIKVSMVILAPKSCLGFLVVYKGYTGYLVAILFNLLWF